MISVELRRPRLGLVKHIVKLVITIFLGSVGIAVLGAVFQLFVGIKGPAGVAVAVAMLEVPVVVLFLITEDSDFDWNHYTMRDNDADALLVLGAGAVGTIIGFVLAGRFVPEWQILWTAMCGIAAAYEVFVYRNRAFFPADTWPWVGSIYFRVKLGG